MGEKIVTETLDALLKDLSYDEANVPHWINFICETVMAKLNDTKKPFKYVVTCLIMQKNGRDSQRYVLLLGCWKRWRSDICVASTKEGRCEQVNSVYNYRLRP